MSNGLAAPVISGLAIGIAFVALFSFVSSQPQYHHYDKRFDVIQVPEPGDADGMGEILISRGYFFSQPLTLENKSEPEEIVVEFTPDATESTYNSKSIVMPDIVGQPPVPQKLKVYIFPRDTSKNTTADDIDWELGIKAGVSFAYGYGDSFGASKPGIYDADGKIIVPNGTDFYISPDLRKNDGSRVTFEEINEQHMFGNDVVVGDILLQPQGVGQVAELVPAVSFVVIEQDIADTDAKLKTISDSIREPKLVNVVIPEGASDPTSGKSYDPQIITVVTGYNNTVRWINQDSFMHFIEADNKTDLDFFRKTNYADPAVHNTLFPGESFVYTFTKAGEIGYHSKPWMRGTVIVLENR